jgi:hypothetical protein
LQRVHRAGVELSPLSDSAAPNREYGPHPRKDALALTPGIQWRHAPEGGWRGLAQFRIPHMPPNGGQPDPEAPLVKRAELKVTEETPLRVAFSMAYELAGAESRAVEESFVITKDGIAGTATVRGETTPASTRALFPALVNDGAKDLEVEVAGGQVVARRDGATLKWEVVEPAGVTLKLTGPPVATRNGYVRAVVGDLPGASPRLRWKLTLRTQP